jgi:hypothetical protein
MLYYFILFYFCFGIGKQSYGDVLPHQHVLSVSSGRLRGTQILFLTP